MFDEQTKIRFYGRLPLRFITQKELSCLLFSLGVFKKCMFKIFQDFRAPAFFLGNKVKREFWTLDVPICPKNCVSDKQDVGFKDKINCLPLRPHKAESF